MNVLSLFDGMSCGRIALERVGIKVDNYFSSEIDKYAIQVANKNYPQDEQNRLGDVTKISSRDLSQIDLLIGGSPCQGFSFAGKQLNFEDERSKLFFEFVRLLEECKPKYFLLENVKMKKEYHDVISKYLGVEPIKINSALVSAQNRERLYWTNILNIEQPEDRGILLKDILKDGYDNSYIITDEQVNGFSEYSMRKYETNKKDINGKSTTLTANPQRATIDNATLIPVLDKRVYIDMGKAPTEENLLYRKLTPIECERLQTVPDNYTEGVSDSQRYKMLGNGWTVDVIAHILKGLSQ